MSRAGLLGVLALVGAHGDEGFVANRLTLAPEARLALRDIDGDGDDDLLLFRAAGVGLRRLGADGRFAPEDEGFLAWPSGHLAWDLADLDGDGSTEVLLLIDGEEVRPLRFVDGTVRAGEPLLTAAAHVPRGVFRMSFVRDVDGDGRPDLVLPASGTYSIHRQLEDGSFDAPLAIALEIEVGYGVGDPERLDSDFGQEVEIPWFTLQDVDGDGDRDLIAEIEDAVLFHLATPELAREPSWTLDLAALRAELPPHDGINLDDVMSEGARQVNWQVSDLDGEGARELVLQIGSKFRVYRGGASTGPSERPSQLLKSSGNVLAFFLRDVEGDSRDDLQILRGQELSLATMLRWLILPGSLDFDLFTYRNEGGTFSRSPTRRNRVTLEFPRIFSFLKDLEELEAEMEALGEVAAIRAAFAPDGLDNDVVDLTEEELLLYLDRAPEDDGAIELEGGDEIDDFLEVFLLQDLDAMDDGETKTIDLGELDQWTFSAGAGLREACAGAEPDLRVSLGGPVAEGTVHARDLSGDGVPDLIVIGRDESGRRVVHFFVATEFPAQGG